MESYKKHLADNPKVLMVHLSYDQEPDEALAWARKEGFPWLTVPESKVETVDLDQYSEGFVPDYVLLDPTGQILAKGKDATFEKIAAMKGS